MPKYNFIFARVRYTLPLFLYNKILLQGSTMFALPTAFLSSKAGVRTYLLSQKHSVILSRTLASEQKNDKMVDPQRVLSYEDMLKVIHQPEKVIIDVRNPDEVYNTGKIPSSINIPLNNVQSVLSMSDEEFRRSFQREKPTSNAELIFYCQSGRRSSQALDQALKLGYTNSKTYLGSWNEWSNRNK